MNYALSKLFPCLGVAPSFLRLVLIILVTQRFDNFDGLRRERWVRNFEGKLGHKLATTFSLESLWQPTY